MIWAKVDIIDTIAPDGHTQGHVIPKGSLVTMIPGTLARRFGHLGGYHDRIQVIHDGRKVWVEPKWLEEGHLAAWDHLLAELDKD